MKFIYKILIIIFMCFIPKNVLAQKSEIIMDVESGRILYENKSQHKQLIASITKIMTAILAIENNDITEIVNIGQEVLEMYGTNIYIEVNEKITVKDLLYGLMLRSGNDAAIALAIHTSKSEEKFVEMMNKKAKELGMNNTKFENPHGLDDNTKNISTAYDMALLSQYASKNKIYNEISSTKMYTATSDKKTYLWYNRNKLLINYEYCTGGKNGYTPAAGKTLVTTAEKAGLKLTIVSLDDAKSYENHEMLYKKYFNKYKNYEIISKKEFNASNKKDIYIKNSFCYPLSENEIKKIQTKIKIYKNKKLYSEEYGKIEIYLGQKKIGMINIYKRKTKKEEANFFLKIKNYLLDIL